jgi:hypothetical protein
MDGSALRIRRRTGGECRQLRPGASRAGAAGRHGRPHRHPADLSGCAAAGANDSPFRSTTRRWYGAIVSPVRTSISQATRATVRSGPVSSRSVQHLASYRQRCLALARRRSRSWPGAQGCPPHLAPPLHACAVPARPASPSGNGRPTISVGGTRLSIKHLPYCMRWRISSGLKVRMLRSSGVLRRRSRVMRAGLGPAVGRQAVQRRSW